VISVGGLFPGDSAVDAVVSMVSQDAVDRIVARSDGMFVCGSRCWRSGAAVADLQAFPRDQRRAATMGEGNDNVVTFHSHVSVSVRPTRSLKECSVSSGW
jgi:hypothetical protein